MKFEKIKKYIYITQETAVTFAKVWRTSGRYVDGDNPRFMSHISDTRLLKTVQIKHPPFTLQMHIVNNINNSISIQYILLAYNKYMLSPKFTINPFTHKNAF